MSDVPPSPPGPPPPPGGLQPPPGYTAYQSSAAEGATGLQSVSGVAKGSIIGVGIAGAAGLLGALMTLTVVDKAQAFLDNPSSSTEDDFTSAYGVTGLFQMVSGIAVIIAVVFTCLLSARIARNNRAIRTNTTWGSGLAAGGWFLPPFVFVIPMLMLREAWKASSPDVAYGDDRWRQSSDNPLLWVWWVLYGIVPLVFIPISLNQFTGFSTDTMDAAEFVDDYAAMGVAQSAVQAVAAVAWIMFARQLTARHRQLTGEQR